MSLVLNQPVLVLNRLWQAVNVCTVRRALMLLLKGQAQVVVGDGGDFQTFDFGSWTELSKRDPSNDYIATISFRLRVPKVILLGIYDRLPKQEVKFTRQNIFDRDKNTCQYCGKHHERRMLNLDHVMPRDRGGPTTWENIVTSCIPCNTRKGNRTPAEASLNLIRKPKRPKWRPFVQINIHVGRHESWQRFVDVGSWTVELG